MTASPMWTIWCDGKVLDQASELRDCPAWAAQCYSAPAARRYALNGGWVRRKIDGRWMDLCRDCQELIRYGGHLEALAESVERGEGV